MITKLHHGWQEMQSSFWFLPAVMVLDAVVLATLLITVDATVDLHVVERWPLLFGAGASGARGLLTAVASSMVTVAGVVFSITIVALSLTSSQYTSRVLRNFMRDRSNQIVLGMFVGIFAYCLVVLRVIRGGDEGAFVPSLAVLVGLILAFVGIGYLIFFIHYISKSIQASSIIATAAQETLAAVDHLFSQELGEEAEEDADGYLVKSFAEQAWSAVPARKTGYIESIDADALLHLARKYQTIVRMEHGIGEFVVEGTPLISVAKRGGLDDATTDELNGVYVIGRQRVVEQDAAFGIRQIVDIAMKALSPGVNDTYDRGDLRGLSDRDPGPVGNAPDYDLPLDGRPGRATGDGPWPELREPVERSLRPDPAECRRQCRHPVADARRATNHCRSDRQPKPTVAASTESGRDRRSG